MDMKSAALDYADDGWHVFPLYGIVNGRCECGVNCGSPGKHPRTANGHLDASTDPEVIERWWDKWPTANIGVATGQRSGIYVVDVDNKRSVDLGNGELIGEGEHSIRVKARELGASLPETRISLTGSGGLHLIYGYPTNPPSNQQLYSNRAGILSSVDTRGDGGYIVVPPSLHKSGNRYLWADQDQPIASLSPTWLSVLTAPAKSDLSLDLELPSDWRIRENEGRHEWLFKMGAKLRGQHGLPYVALFGALSAYNGRHCDPPLKTVDVEHIVRSCMKYELGMPVLPVDTSDIPELDEGLDLAIPFAQFMDEEPPAFKNLVSRLLHSGEVMIVGGQPNIGKSWAIMDMMMAIASGGMFANHFHCESGPVVFIDEEGSRRGDWERFRMLLSGSDNSALDYPIYSKIGAGIKVDSPMGMVAVTRLIERYNPAAVFMDSLVRMHGGDESNNRAMATFFEHVKKLVENYGTSFIFTHHVPKPPAQGDRDPAWMLRGAGDIQGFPDSVMIFLPGIDTSEIEVVHTKMRNGEKLPRFTLKLWLDNSDGTARIGYQEHDPLARTNKKREDVWTVLREATKSHRPVSVDTLAALTGQAQSTVKGHLKALESIGAAVSAQGEGGQMVYQAMLRGLFHNGEENSIAEVLRYAD